MTYSGLGPHVWVPRRSGLGTLAPGKYPLPTDAGQVKSSLESTASNYSGAIRAEAQGYVTADAGSAARSAFRSATGVDAPWVPTDPKQVGPWAKQMGQIYGSDAMQYGIEQGKVTLAALGVPENPTGFGPPMSEDETSQWALGYLSAHPDMLTNPTSQGAVAMMQAFVSAQGNAIGLPPEFIAASDLAHGFPSDPDAAVSWGMKLGTAYLSQYGVPIVSDVSATGFVQAAGRFGIAQVTPGVPFSLCEATYTSLANGSINFSEAQGLVVGACAWIGGAVGQAFGIPAPLGALLGQLVGSALTGPVAEALGFGPSDSEKLNAAQDAARNAAAAATVACTDLAKALWLEYQQYWESVETNLQGLIRANQEWLFLTGSCGANDGLLLFPESTPGENTLNYILDEYGRIRQVNGKDARYPYPIARACAPMTGCRYNQTPIDSLAIRDSYDLTIADLNKKRIPTIKWSGAYAGCDALGALAYWGARRYVTPYQVIYAMRGLQADKGGCYPNYCRLPGKPYMWLQEYDKPESQFASRNVPMWDSTVHSDLEYLQNIGLVQTAGAAGERVGDCMTPQWAQHMFLSLQQAPAASALVQRDLARTVSYVTTQYGITKHMEELAGNRWMVAGASAQREAVRAVSARTASFRNAVREAQRRGRKTADLLNYGLLAAGGGALLGWAAAKRSR